MQSFTNCSNMGLSHKVQSFGKRLLQHGSPMGTQILPENLLMCGLLPTSCTSCQELPPAWTPHGSQLPSGTSTFCSVGSSMGCTVGICSTFSCSFFIDLDVFRAVSRFSHSSLPQLLCSSFYPFLNRLSTEALPTSLMHSALASSRSTLEVAGAVSVQYGTTPGVFLQKPPLQRLFPLPPPCHVNQIPSQVYPRRENIKRQMSEKLVISTVIPRGIATNVAKYSSKGSHDTGL